MLAVLLFPVFSLQLGGVQDTQERESIQAHRKVLFVFSHMTEDILYIYIHKKTHIRVPCQKVLLA